MDPKWIGSMLCSFGMHDTVLIGEDIEYSLQNSIDRDSVLDNDPINIDVAYRCMRCGEVWYDRGDYMNSEINTSMGEFEDSITHWSEYE